MRLLVPRGWYRYYVLSTTYHVEIITFLYFSRNKTQKNNNTTMNTTTQSDWVPDDSDWEPVDSPWVLNPCSFWGYYHNLSHRCSFIVWVIGRSSYQINPIGRLTLQWLRNVLAKIISFSHEPDRHVYLMDTGRQLPGLPSDMIDSGNHQWLSQTQID